MKTIFSRMLVIAATLLGSLFVCKAHAQTNPFPITNNLNCAIVVNVDIQKGSQPCSPCSSSTGITIPPLGSTVTVPIPGACTPVCDIIVTVTSIGGVALQPKVSDKLSDADSNTGAGAGCASSVTVDVQMTGATVN